MLCQSQGGSLGEDQVLRGCLVDEKEWIQVLDRMHHHVCIPVTGFTPLSLSCPVCKVGFVYTGGVPVILKRAHATVAVSTETLAPGSSSVAPSLKETPCWEAPGTAAR